MGELQLLELTTLAAEDTGVGEGDRIVEASDGWCSTEIFCDLRRYGSINLTLYF